MPTAFFSWQADTPSKEGRNFLEEALAHAIERISRDVTLEEAVRGLEIDKDTKGVAGQPPIVDTIFKKIDKAAVFIPDLTFVGERLDKRPTPNPNVLIEYGWALKSLGHGRIVPVMNTVYGSPTPETMPFDMRHLRYPILYNCSAEDDGKKRKQVLEYLAKQLEDAIRIVLGSPDFKKSLPETPVFPAQEPKDGKGKFRAKGEAIGINHDHFRGGFHEVTLANAPAMWLRVMPVANPGRDWSVTDITNAIRQDGLTTTLSGHPGRYDYVRGEDGYGIYAVMNEPQGQTPDLVYVFTTGEIWAVDTYFLVAMKNNHRNAIPNVDNNFINALKRYSEFLLTTLGLKPPYRWIAGMEDLKGRGLFVPPPPGQMYLDQGPQGICLADMVIAEGTFDPAKMTAKESLHPFFTKLFDKCGVLRPQHLDA